MTLEFQEHISSLVDGEAGDVERDKLIEKLKNCSDSQQVWARYCVIGEAMKRNLPANPKHDLLSRVRNALESEPALLAPSPGNETPESTPAEIVTLPESRKASIEQKSFWGYGIAASVALVAVIGFQSLSNSPVENLPSSEVAVANEPATQQINIVSMPEMSQAAMVNDSANKKVTENPIYAEQSLMNDGQWTRITQIGSIQLENNLRGNSAEANVNFTVENNGLPLAHSVSQENPPQ